MAVFIQRNTVEEFDRFVELPENADRLFEFIGGEIVEVPSSPYASAIASHIGFFIQEWENDLHGHITGEGGGYVVSGERYIPNVAYISKARQPKLPRYGYNPIAPDLAVEVISPADDPDHLLIKVSNYLAAGTMVWSVSPEKKKIRVHAPGQTVKTFGIEDMLDGGDVLPGFNVAVKDIFPK